LTGGAAPTYTVPSDNPWAATDVDDESARGELWSVGLRNPWRFSFDRASGDLWVGGCWPEQRRGDQLGA
ncbi:MAG: PQQ-dependent sugar dehydrogenase, partial [Caldilineaceae bacterium]|nr:PQQ-dependent sugar dehydrogenase [Caldilineaceae bacterium]